VTAGLENERRKAQSGGSLPHLLRWRQDVSALLGPQIGCWRVRVISDAAANATARQFLRGNGQAKAGGGLPATGGAGGRLTLCTRRGEAGLSFLRQ
jgi:hypothetical protein